MVTFFLAKQKKVTSCRATPGGFVLALHLMLGYAVKLLTQPTHCTLRQTQSEREIYCDCASNFAIKLSSSFANGATNLIGSPVNGCANAML